MSSDPSTKTTTSEQNRGPLKAQWPFWKDIWNMTGDALHGKQPTSFVAGPNATQLSFVDQLKKMAPQLGAAGGDLSEMAKKIAQGYFLDPRNDPTFRGAANSAINPITHQLRTQVLPGITDASMRAGGVGGGPAAYGGARQDIQENSAVHDWTKMSSDVTSSMANRSREMGMALIPQAGQIASSANSLMLAPAMATGMAGGLEQQWAQGGLDDQIKKYLFGFAGPQNAAGIMSQGGFGTQTGTSTETGSAPSMATQWLQGLTGGASGLASLFGAQGAFPGGMQSLMAMLPMLSDRRAKENIEKLVDLPNGLVLYRFNYLDQPTTHIGFMADEVEKLFPEAVSEVGGVKYVDYKKATESLVGEGHG